MTDPLEPFYAKLEAEDAARYRFLRAQALKGRLESFVAMGQADFISTAVGFDAWIDREMHAIQSETKPCLGERDA